MELICSRCNSKYRIADDKVIGRKVVKIRCRKCGDIIEKNNEEDLTFSPQNLDGFNFDEAKTTVYSKENEDKMMNSFNKPGGKLSFNDQTKAEKPRAKSKENISKNSFELTREISIPKQFLDKKPKNESTTKNNKLGLQQNRNQNRNQNQNRNPNRSMSTKSNNHLERQEYYPEKEKGSIFLTVIFVFLIIVTSIFIFILYRNNWELDVNNFPKMINNALNGTTSEQENKKKLVSIDEQFLISPDIKMDSYRNKKRKYLLVISGSLKNISSSLKGLVTIRADIFNKKDGVKLLSKRVYAGNTFTKKQLISFKKEIDLNAEYLQSGQNSINWNIARGKSIPFMIVFYSDKKIVINDINAKLKITSAQ